MSRRRRVPSRRAHPARGVAAVLLAVAVLLSGCTGSSGTPAPTTSDETTVPVTAGEPATLHLPDGATVTVPPGAVTGTGQLVGGVLTSPPPPRVGIPVGHAYDFHLDGAQLTGEVTLTLPAPPLSAVDGDPDPDTALMAYYDQTAQDWVPVAATYDPTQHMVTVQTPHLSWWSPFRLDFGALKSDTTKALKAVFDVPDTAPQPVCPGADQLKANGIVVGTDHPGVPILKSCAGVSDGHAQLRVANNRGYAMSVEYPDQWTASVDSTDEVDQALATWVSEKMSIAPRGRRIAIVPPGQTVTLTVNGRQNPIVQVTADGQAYLASALLYGADTLLMTFGKIPGAKTPKPSVLVKAVETLKTAGECVEEGRNLAHTDPTTSKGVADLFAKDYEFAVGCLKDQWGVAFGLGAGVTAFVAGVGVWLVSGVETALQGVVATSDILRYPSGVRFSVEVAATGLGTVTDQDLLAAPVPASCQHPAGNLKGGRLPGIAQGNGVMHLAWLDGRGSETDLLARGDLDGDGSGDAAATLYCDAGGVAWPEIIGFYTRGPRLLGSVSVGDINLPGLEAGQNAFVNTLRYTDGAVTATWSTEQSGDAAATPTLDYAATLRWNDNKIVPEHLSTTTEVATLHRFVDAVRQGRLDTAHAVGTPAATSDAANAAAAHPSAFTAQPTCYGLIDLQIPATAQPLVDAGASTEVPGADRLCLLPTGDATAQYVAVGMKKLAYAKWQALWVRVV